MSCYHFSLSAATISDVRVCVYVCRCISHSVPYDAVLCRDPDVSAGAVARTISQRRGTRSLEVVSGVQRSILHKELNKFILTFNKIDTVPRVLYRLSCVYARCMHGDLQNSALLVSRQEWYSLARKDHVHTLSCPK